MVARLQIKASQIGKILETLENKKNEAEGYGRQHGGASGLSSAKHQKADGGSSSVKKHFIDPIPPFNANKIRKSPSGNPVELNN